LNKDIADRCLMLTYRYHLVKNRESLRLNIDNDNDNILPI